MTSLAEYQRRLVDRYEGFTMDQLKAEIDKARAKRQRASDEYRRTGLRSEKIHIEDANVRIENVTYVINFREGNLS